MLKINDSIKILVLFCFSICQSIHAQLPVDTHKHLKFTISNKTINVVYANELPIKFKGQKLYSEFKVIETPNNLLKFYSAIEECTIQKVNNALLIETIYILNVDGKFTKKRTSLFRDRFFLKNSKISFERKISPDFPYLSAGKSNLVLKNYRSFLKLNPENANLEKTINQIQALFTAAMSKNDSAQNYLLNFEKYYKGIVDGELAEELHFFQKTLREYKR
ncbi:hypothetical protein [Pedobacter sp. NJ-S-72]